MFQNLLFHTDPSTSEYESTLQLVAEVENVVRSIQDEKIQKEERDKTRDSLARIEGLDKVKQLAAPKPSHVLLDERRLTPRDLLRQSTGRLVTSFILMKALCQWRSTLHLNFAWEGYLVGPT
jgi:hypothetical protein